MFPKINSRNTAVIFCGILFLGVIIFGIYHLYYEAESKRIEERVVHYQEELLNALGQHRYLPYALTGNSVYSRALRSEPAPELNSWLRDITDRSGVDAIFLMDHEGLTIAASNAGETPTFLGQNYGFRPYFEQAMESGSGEFFAIGATTSIPGYFFAQRVSSPEGIAQGVLVVKVSLEPLKRIWKELDENVFVTDSNGIVVLSSVDDWNYLSTHQLTQPKRAEIQSQRQFGEEPLTLLDITQIDQGKSVVDGRQFLTANMPLPALGWKLHYLTPQRVIVNRAVSMFFLVVTPLILVLTTYLAISSARTRKSLERSQRDAEQLRDLNLNLESEIAERKRTEVRLEAAKTSLEKVSRLAALGQLSASVTHELGQPISALQNYVASAELPDSDLGTDGAELMQRIKKILKRITHVTSQLRFFAKAGEKNLVVLDLVEVIQNVIDLQFVDLGVTTESLSIELPGKPVKVEGNRLRLEQVLINLIRNARQATALVSQPRIDVSLKCDKEIASVSIADNGPGVDESDRDKIYEPFFTTKASGEGMGLGLVISSTIMQEHDGQIDVQVSKYGGAEFVMRLPQYRE
ncbi:MAG: hypothetical protein KTR18_08215 [Acidiferrobacterales bacterium]|nr:hypothetical protein [Acidiferrobacterales bacterium]